MRTFLLLIFLLPSVPAFLGMIGSASLTSNSQRTELTIFAAASLTEAFQTLASKFEAIHPSADIRFNFGGSQQLVQQMIEGAAADLFASASIKQMNTAVASGVIDTGSIRTFARNRLAMILPADNPAHLSGLKDLARPRVKIVLADSSVPVGQYARQMLYRCSKPSEFGESYMQSVLQNVVSYEENVRAVLSKVQLGECDAGIVYTSDIARDTAHQVLSVTIPDRLNVIAEYPIAIVEGSKSRQIAGEFMQYLLSDEGKLVLSEFGFLGADSPDRR